jgi:hypothetical protein
MKASGASSGRVKTLSFDTMNANDGRRRRPRYMVMRCGEVFGHSPCEMDRTESSPSFHEPPEFVKHHEAAFSFFE